MKESPMRQRVKDMDMYKKRTAGRIAEIKIPRKVLADFQEDGHTVEIPRRFNVADHEADCLDHVHLVSEALEPEQRAAVEANSEMLEELGSAERSVLGKHREHSQSECAGDMNLAQGPQSRGGSTIRAVISRQQLEKLLAQGSIKSCNALLPQSALQNNEPLVGDMAQLISTAMKMTRSPGSPWSPILETINEAPVQLTRSPVITRNCDEVANFLQTET